MLLIEQEEKGLPEGATQLPEGATIKFYYLEMVDVNSLKLTSSQR